MIRLYETEDEPDWRATVAMIALAGVVLAATVVGITMLPGGQLDAAAANDETTTLTNETLGEKAPYYEENTSDVNNESWMNGHENATLDNMASMATRVGGFVIGTRAAQGGVGPANGLVLALVVFGVVATAGARSRVGTVGGSVLGIAAAAALSVVGLAPSWLFAVIMFGVGLVAAKALINILR